MIRAPAGHQRARRHYRFSRYGPLVGAERGHRLDPRRPSCGDVPRHHRHQRQQDGRRREGDGIGRRRAEQERGDEPCHAERRDRSEHDAGECDLQRSREHEPADVAGGGAERHADAHLLHAPADGVRDDAVDAQAGERQGQQREPAEKGQQEPPRRHRAINEELQRTDIRRDERGIERAERGPYGRGQRRRGKLGSDDQVRARADLRVDEIHLKRRLLFQAGLAHVGDPSVLLCSRSPVFPLSAPAVGSLLSVMGLSQCRSPLQSGPHEEDDDCFCRHRRTRRPRPRRTARAGGAGPGACHHEGRSRGRADRSGHEAVRGPRRQLRRPWRRVRRAAGDLHRPQPVGHQPRRRSRSRRPHRQLAAGRVYEEGRAVRDHGEGPLRARRHEPDVRRPRRRLRSAQQRRRRGPLRSARESLADRDADLRADSARAVQGRGRASAPASSRAPGQLAVNGQAATPGRPLRRRPIPSSRRRPPAAVNAVSRRRPDSLRRRHRPARTRCATRSARRPIRSAPYYRYAFDRPLFPDYPRPAVWPDGYYIPDQHRRRRDPEARVRRRSQQDAQRGAGDRAVRDHRRRELPEQRRHRRPGAPACRRAEHHDGGRRNAAEEDLRRRWHLRVDVSRGLGHAREHQGCGSREDSGRAVSLSLQRPADQLRAAAGHRSPARRAGRQDHAAARLPPRRTARVDRRVAFGRDEGRRRRRPLVRVPSRQADAQPVLYQQGTYAPDGFFRWMASIAMDKRGNIGVGYSFGGTPHFAGQRFAARMAGDPKGKLTLRETVLVEGEAAQTNTLRWEDYTTTAIDPSDDCTFWYGGDYFKKDAASYSSRIGSFRLPGCR